MQDIIPLTSVDQEVGARSDLQTEVCQYRRLEMYGFAFTSMAVPPTTYHGHVRSWQAAVIILIALPVNAFLLLQHVSRGSHIVH